MTEDLLRLFDTLPHHTTKTADNIRRSIPKHLAGQRSEAHRARATKILEEGLRKIEEAVWSAIEDAFPGLDYATDWLEIKVDEAGLSRNPRLKKSYLDPLSKEEQLLDKLILRFGEVASRDRDGYSGRQSPMQGYDSGDSDHEEVKERILPNLRKGIQD